MKMAKGLAHSSCGKRLRTCLFHLRKWRDLVGVINVFIIPGEVSSKNNRTKLFLMRVLEAVAASLKYIKLHSNVRKLFFCSEDYPKLQYTLQRAGGVSNLGDIQNSQLL